MDKYASDIIGLFVGLCDGLLVESEERALTPDETASLREHLFAISLLCDDELLPTLAKRGMSTEAAMRIEALHLQLISGRPSASEHRGH